MLQVEKIERLRHIMVTMGRCNRIRGPLLKALSECIVYCGRLLRNVKQERLLPPPHLIENIYHVLWSTEKMLLLEQETIINRRSQSFSKIISISLLFELREQLESSLLHISDIFPAFAHYVWKIVILITSLISSCEVAD